MTSEVPTEPEPLTLGAYGNEGKSKLTEIPPKGRRSKQGVKASKPPTHERTSGSPVSKSDMLEITKWHIDRYDRLRSSTSLRASILLSANAILTTGSLILINYHVQSKARDRSILIESLFAALTILALSLTMRSLWGYINAIAARKTTRALYSSEIPTRFLFNWGDTLKSVDGHSDFARKVTELSLDSILGHAVSELWTAILQHAQRHRHLRSAISKFRYCIIAQLALAIFTFLAALR
ncbi:hypothetical protein AB0393_33035 [Streptomyces cyaneofuscatus]|uniref:hypothetical protein n=1 Tax=Streptomyces TaxID=1883 RepID=UPI00344C94D3